MALQIGFFRTSLGIAFVSLVVATGCGDSEAPGETGGSGGEATGGSGAVGGSGGPGGSGASGGSGGSGAMGGSGGAGGSGGSGGSTTVEEIDFGKYGIAAIASGGTEGDAFYVVSAVFADGTGTKATVTTIAEGDCEFRSASEPTGPDPVFASAGTLSLSGPTDYELDPSEQGVYLDFALGVDEPPLFDLGDTVGLAFAGDVVPAFTEQFAVPPALDGVQPPIEDDVPISAAEDFSVSWSPLDSGLPVRLSIQTDLEDVSASIECVVDGANGSLTVPQALLQEMPPGPVTVAIENSSRREIMVDDWAVTLAVAHEANSHSGGTELQ